VKGGKGRGGGNDCSDANEGESEEAGPATAGAVGARESHGDEKFVGDHRGPVDKVLGDAQELAELRGFQ
jgi:hypothetical protein